MAKATLDDVRDGSHECNADESFPVYDGRGIYLRPLKPWAELREAFLNGGPTDA